MDRGFQDPLSACGLAVWLPQESHMASTCPGDFLKIGCPCLQPTESHTGLPASPVYKCLFVLHLLHNI